MYTKLDDERQAKLVKNYMQSHPDCKLKNIVQDCIITRSRLQFLERSGYLSLPEATPRGLRNQEYIAKMRLERLNAQALSNAVDTQ